jgi:hypothetical protein
MPHEDYLDHLQVFLCGLRHEVRKPGEVSEHEGASTDMRISDLDG